MSIRLRLTLLYSTILAVTLITFSAILYLNQQHFTYDNIKVNLMRQANIFINGPRFLGGPGSEQGGGQPPRGPEPAFTLPEGTLPGRWTQTRSFDGAVAGRTLDLSGATLPLSAQGLTAVQHGQGWYETAQVQNEPLLIFSHSYTARSGATQIMQVAAPIGEREQTLQNLRLMLTIGCSLAIVLAFVAGWLLAGTSLQPIHRITHTAHVIGAEHDFSRRVQHAGPNDEVGQLATTFNSMLTELEIAYHQLQGALDSQRRFVADASHELRTPLTTVRGNIELLYRNTGLEPVERADILTDTREEVERLIRLVNQLLVLARADAGQSLACTAIPLAPVLEDAYRQAQSLAPNRTITCANKVDAQVSGNRDALKQVLLILLDNALAHTPSDSTVAMAAARADGHVTISVSDSGPGIAPDVLPHVFERFYRGEVSRNGPGTGLGLAIAKELVEAQNGTISAESEPGQGSVFTVTLPVAG
jgi:two-component system, OmpR family, sensor kinase